eukprot:gene15708-33182_t
MMYLMVVVGGAGYFFGPIVGAAVGVVLPEWLRDVPGVSNWYLPMFGAAVVLLMVWLPDGLLSIPSRLRAKRGWQTGAKVMTAPLLKVTGLKKAYGAIQAVGDVSFAVMPGEIFGVIGPNGSGKTTLFNSILGQISPDAGAIELHGNTITGLSPLELSRRGVGRTFQTLQVFGKMTVRDNLIVAAQEHQGSMLSRMFAPSDSGLGAKADGTTVLMVEQNVKSALKISDEAIALESGRLVLQKPASELLADPNIERLFLGGAHQASAAPAT